MESKKWIENNKDVNLFYGWLFEDHKKYEISKKLLISIFNQNLKLFEDYNYFKNSKYIKKQKYIKIKDLEIGKKYWLFKLHKSAATACNSIEKIIIE